MAEMSYAPYAVSNSDLTERTYPQTGHKYRTEFQRDRDRIVHSKAFRRLEYKTQVFVNHMGDSYRTRMTHSIEVSQIARTVARVLRLNEDLTETLALAHDLGHPPFGHAGERALHKLMKDHGGFDHNDQTLRVVQLLEVRYPEFEGLNLTRATILGLQKHNNLPEGQSHTLESQIVDICDEIAYNNHDLDDGIEGGYLNLEELDTLEIWKTARSQTDHINNLPKKIMIRETIRKIIDRMVSDLIETTANNIKVNTIGSLNDVLNFSNKNTGTKLVSFSPELQQQIYHLKRFLFQKLYRHPEVAAMNMRAEEIIKRLFNFFTESSDPLPEEFRLRSESGEELRLIVADFIAGMTDRYALIWNKKILGSD